MPYVTPKSIQFGVRIPREFEKDPAISGVRKKFHNQVALSAILVFIAFIIIPSLFGLYIVALLSLPVAILFTYLSYYRSFRVIQTIKVNEGWYNKRPEASSAFYNQDSPHGKLFTGILFIFPALIVLIATIYVGISIYPTLPNILPTHFGTNGIPNQYAVKSVGTAFSLVFVQIGMTAGMYLLGYVITKTSQIIDVSRPNVTFEQQERFKFYSRDILYLFTATIDMTFMFSSFMAWQLIGPQYTFTLTLLPILLGTAMVIVVAMSMGQMGSRLNVKEAMNEDTGLSNRNDDKEWKGGVLNYNKDSSAILVPKRFGVGWTLNFARPTSWLLIVAIIALAVIVVIVVRFIH